MIFFFLKEMIYFWLCWLFVAASKLFLVAVSRGLISSYSAGRGFSSPCLLSDPYEKPWALVLTDFTESCGSGAYLPYMICFDWLLFSETVHIIKTQLLKFNLSSPSIYGSHVQHVDFFSSRVFISMVFIL